MHQYSPGPGLKDREEERGGEGRRGEERRGEERRVFGGQAVPPIEMNKREFLVKPANPLVQAVYTTLRSLGLSSLSTRMLVFPPSVSDNATVPFQKERNKIAKVISCVWGHAFSCGLVILSGKRSRKNMHIHLSSIIGKHSIIQSLVL